MNLNEKTIKLINRTRAGKPTRNNIYNIQTHDDDDDEDDYDDDASKDKNVWSFSILLCKFQFY